MQQTCPLVLTIKLTILFTLATIMVCPLDPPLYKHPISIFVFLTFYIVQVLQLIFFLFKILSWTMIISCTLMLMALLQRTKHREKLFSTDRLKLDCIIFAFLETTSINSDLLFFLANQSLLPPGIQDSVILHS